ncbi:MAG: hypothetical protein NZT61_06295 [Deltaproteobacteria bacterium]|nr:hypothetical protein [Deltaproteobacteria bacterium]MCX7953341.1 hypothetical protein [Deltaproteobacteria bacterium]
MRLLNIAAILACLLLSSLSCEQKWVITSNEVTGKLDTRSFTYSGNVKIQAKDATITCEKLNGTLDDDEKIKELTATGSVYIVNSEGVEVFGEKAVYDQSAKTITITGNPKMLRNKNSLIASEIVYYLASNTFEARGGVETIIFEETPKR